MIEWYRNASWVKSRGFAKTKLAIDGGTPAITHPLPQMYGLKLHHQVNQALMTYSSWL